MNSLLTLEEVKTFLDLHEENLEKFIREGKLHAYKIGGIYLRFRKDEVMSLKFDVLGRKTRPSRRISLPSRILDFWKFNNFYILSLLLAVVLIYFAARF